MASSLHPLVLLTVISSPDIISSVTVINCSSTIECRNSVLSCTDHTDDCSITCSSPNSCESALIYCPIDRACTVFCTATGSCKSATIFAQKSSALQVIDGCTEDESCHDLAVWCPTATEPDTLCQLEGNENLGPSTDETAEGLQIFAIHGWSDLDIDSTDSQQSNLTSRGNMHCAINYTTSCDISTDDWSCTDSASLCNHIEISSTETASDSVADREEMWIIVVGLLVAVCFIAFCCYRGRKRNLKRLEEEKNGKTTAVRKVVSTSSTAPSQPSRKLPAGAPANWPRRSTDDEPQPAQPPAAVAYAPKVIVMSAPNTNTNLNTNVYTNSNLGLPQGEASKSRSTSRKKSRSSTRQKAHSASARRKRPKHKKKAKTGREVPNPIAVGVGIQNSPDRPKDHRFKTINTDSKTPSTHISPQPNSGHPSPNWSPEHSPIREESPYIAYSPIPKSRAQTMPMQQVSRRSDEEKLAIHEDNSHKPPSSFSSVPDLPHSHTLDPHVQPQQEHQLMPLPINPGISVSVINEMDASNPHLQEQDVQDIHTAYTQRMHVKDPEWDQNHGRPEGPGHNRNESTSTTASSVFGPGGHSRQNSDQLAVPTAIIAKNVPFENHATGEEPTWMRSPDTWNEFDKEAGILSDQQNLGHMLEDLEDGDLACSFGTNSQQW
eukprot:CAMPEP_0197045686 /NCGR_PEP_ID=MMETSP1384-20130603/21494_1 /TAXON_ID=29189 /ORGANISM="Ammonia sp." /LENGTH=662 /DNA_ID=CAMNT_0042477337 /DNA_START=31 /DNA_END=2019 /DNA_ORIENTATION=-